MVSEIVRFAALGLRPCSRAATPKIFAMPRRNSPNEIQELSDLSRLGELVFDKRLGQRAIAKKSRRNRHYERQFIRNTLAHNVAVESLASEDSAS